MTPDYSRDQMMAVRLAIRLAIRRRSDDEERRRERTTDLWQGRDVKPSGTARVVQLSIAAPAAISQITRIVEMTNSEICANEFSSWTIFDAVDHCDFGNDNFLDECMQLYSSWCPKRPYTCGYRSCWCFAMMARKEEPEEKEDEDSDPSASTRSTHTASDFELDSDHCWDTTSTSGDSTSRTFANVTAPTPSEEDIVAEPETRHDNLFLAALLSTKDLPLADSPVSPQSSSDVDSWADEDEEEEEWTDSNVTLNSESDVDEEEEESTDSSLNNSESGMYCEANIDEPCDCLIIADREETETVEECTTQFAALTVLGPMMVDLGSYRTTMDSLAVLLFETRHLHYINERCVLPLPPTLMIEAAAQEMDPPNSLASTVSARLSSSSTFDLFSSSDAAITPPLSAFPLDLTRAPHGRGRAFRPLSTWGTASCVSVTARTARQAWHQTSEAFCPLGCTSSTSSLFPNPSEASCSSCASSLSPGPTEMSSSSSASSPSEVSFSSSASSLFPDPSEASSSSSLFMDPSSVHSSACDSSSLLLSSSIISCGCCTHAVSSVDFNDIDILDCPSLPSSRSSTSSGYESDVDDCTSLLTTVSATTQTSGICQTTVSRMLAECDSLVEKLVEMKKKLMELL